MKKNVIKKNVIFFVLGLSVVTIIMYTTLALFDNMLASLINGVTGGIFMYLLVVSLFKNK